MKLTEILENKSLPDIEIEKLAFDTKDVTENTLFFCLKGKKNDGHKFLMEAFEKGAVFAVTEEESEFPHLEVSDTRHALSLAAVNFYNNPSKRLTMIGITGTNGKTTTSYIIKSILEECGNRVGLIGTNGVFYGDKKLDYGLTTPDPTQLNSALKEMADSGVTHVVMEVSAHALALNKVDGIVFDVAAFTNLTQDHLDYFENMENYKSAKSKLFTPFYAKNAVINCDDKYGLHLYNICPLNKISYGCENPCDVFAVKLKMDECGMSFFINIADDIECIRFCLPGRFNMYNVLCAAAIAKSLGINSRFVARGVYKLKRVEGRFNIIHTKKASVIIDFAHTDDGLKNVLSAVKEFASKRIITVFGCGGNRDKTKRPKMGAVAEQFSDFCVITSDNPRFEQPMNIIADIINGIKGNNYIVEPDRKAAIKRALEISERGDIVVIAGKGAEKYQDIMGVKRDYNDEEYVRTIIEENNAL